MKVDQVLSESSPQRWKQYLQLCKPKVVALICFTTLVGMLLAVPGVPPLNALLYGNLGIALSAASAAAFNHYLDRNTDANMNRTKARPLPSGDLSTGNVIVFASLLAVMSMIILYFLVNALTAVLTFCSLIGYAVIYTVYLKRATPQNIVIGGAAGAAPPVLGWCAVTATIDPHALLLFAIIFIWTPPHFWALAIARRDDYANVDIPMLPVTHGIEFTGLHVVYYTILLCIVSLLPYLYGMSGIIYLLSVVILDGLFLYYVMKLKRSADNKIAMQTFGYSISYLMLLFTALLIDHYWIIRPI
ncbi:MAG: heme o synthase [Gammaproteobacteria bacterium]|nr:heme o synthase [Gammaproteobacteria bacterium]